MSQSTTSLRGTVFRALHGCSIGSPPERSDFRNMELATAVTKDGWILGQKMLTLHDAGAYGRFSPYGLTKHSFHHTGAYSIPNLHFDGYVVFTNRTPTTAMRGFGVTSVSFAVETHMPVVLEMG